MIAMPLFKCSLMQAEALTVWSLLQYISLHHLLSAQRSQPAMQCNILFWSSCFLSRSHDPLIDHVMMLLTLHISAAIVYALHVCIAFYHRLKNENALKAKTTHLLCRWGLHKGDREAEHFILGAISQKSKEPLLVLALYPESLNGWCQVHGDPAKTPEASFFLSIVKKNEDTQCGSTVCLF